MTKPLAKIAQWIMCLAEVALLCLLLSPFLVMKWIEDSYRWARRQAAYGGNEELRRKYDDLGY